MNGKSLVARGKPRAGDQDVGAMDEDEEKNGELNPVSSAKLDQPATPIKPVPLQAFDYEDDGDII